MPNARIQRQVKPVPLRACAAHFRPCVLTDPTAVLHHADLLPPDFTAPVCVTWHRVGDVADLIEPERLVPRAISCTPKQRAMLARTEVPGGARLRRNVVHAMPMRQQVHKGINHEASLHVAELAPLARAMPTCVLQQCFIPESGFPGFAQGGPAVAPKQAKVLDASIRHCSRDRASALPWAPKDVLSFVLRYKQRTWSRARGKAGGGLANWSRRRCRTAVAATGPTSCMRRSTSPIGPTLQLHSFAGPGSRSTLRGQWPMRIGGSTCDPERVQLAVRDGRLERRSLPPQPPTGKSAVAAVGRSQDPAPKACRRQNALRSAIALCPRSTVARAALMRP